MHVDIWQNQYNIVKLKNKIKYIKKKEMATHSRILAWKIPWQRSLVGYSPWGCKELDTTEYTHTHTHTQTYRSRSCGNLNRMNPKKFMSRYIIIKLLKTKDNKNNLKAVKGERN